MQISQITDTLESFAPIALQESFDNCGLLVGNPQCEATGVLLCIDVVENIVDEAIASGCNLIVAHHPLIFRGIKNLTVKPTSNVVLKRLSKTMWQSTLHTPTSILPDVASVIEWQSY